MEAAKLPTTPQEVEALIKDPTFWEGLEAEYTEKQPPQAGGSYTVPLAQLCLAAVIVIFSAL